MIYFFSWIFITIAVILVVRYYTQKKVGFLKTAIMGILAFVFFLLVSSMIISLLETSETNTKIAEKQRVPHQELIDECVATFCLSEKYLYEYLYIRANHYETSGYKINEEYRKYTEKWKGKSLKDAEECMTQYAAIGEKGILLLDSLIGLGIKSQLVDSILSFNQEILKLNKKENTANEWAMLGNVVQRHYNKYHFYIDKMEKKNKGE